MSSINTETNEQIWKLYQFLGLHENPDGDTKLKMGEATVCRNWKVTRDRNLKKRPGFEKFQNFSQDFGYIPYVRGMWFGNIGDDEIGIVCADESIYEFYRNGYLNNPVKLRMVDSANGEDVDFFAYDNVVYILDGLEYYRYDGTTCQEVAGYRPLVVVSRAPGGADGQTLEEVNKLNGLRRVWFSPDGTTKVFQLPETGLASIDYVIDTATGDPYSGSYTKSTTNGTVTFTAAPARGVNTIEIGYTFPTSNRTDVTTMKHAELFLGAQDDCIVLYGNGTNKAVYSSVDYDGKPSAEYFPDLNVISVADENTPITSMIRHNNRLMCFKTTSAYTINFGLTYLADGTQKYAFYTTPVNKSIGNAAMAQVMLVDNAPITLFEHDLYKWENTSPYSAEITRDERMAIRISDRVFSTLKTFDLSECICFDDNYNKEYYIFSRNYNSLYDGYEALVWNYAADAWYTYTSPFKVHCMIRIHDDLIFGSNMFLFKANEEKYYDDDGTTYKHPIDCYWESGSIDFGKPYMRKFISEIWIGTKPDNHSKVILTITTDKKSEYTEREVSTNLMSFAHMDFAHFSFKTNRKPQVKKLKIKAKKFAFLKLILKTQETDSSATVLMIDPKVRETGYVK